MRIRKLSSQVSDKIAAGEVIERPASVVKELVENSIDAASTRISIDIKSAGKELIRISDNGTGISKADAGLAFERHATGKIRDIADIYSIQTMGFRGEALSSISAVSRIELISKSDEDEFAYCVELENGILSKFKPIGANRGTAISVKDLFYNTPARFNFLKSDRYESNAIRELVDKLAIGNPQIAFTLNMDGNLIYRTDGRDKLLNTLHRIYGDEFVKGLIPVDFKADDLRIDGYVSNLQTVRGTKKWQMCFINGRYVSDNLVVKCVNEQYSKQLGSGKFPVFVLNVKLPASKLDVNVHPTKQEVLFKDTERIELLSVKMLEDMLANYDMSRSLNFKTDRVESTLQAEEAQAPQVLKRLDVVQELYESFYSKGSDHYVLKNEQKSEANGIEEKSSSAEQMVDNLTVMVLGEQNDSSKYGGEQRADIQRIHKMNITKKFEPVLCTSSNDEKSNLPVSTGIKARKVNEINESAEADKENKADRTPENPEIKASMLDFDPSKFFEKLEQSSLEQMTPDLRPVAQENIYLGMKVLAQVFDSYILTENAGVLYFINQHYAMERIIYDKFLRSVLKGKLPSQILLMLEKLPENLELDEAEIEYLKRFSIVVESYPKGLYLRELPVIADMEMDINSAIAFIDSLHGYFLEHEAEAMRADLNALSEYENESIYSGFHGFIRRNISLAACNMAIKEGVKLNISDMNEILNGLKVVDLPYTSIHGKALLMRLDKSEIDNKF